MVAAKTIDEVGALGDWEHAIAVEPTTREGASVEGEAMLTVEPRSDVEAVGDRERAVAVGPEIKEGANI